jgi:hypothetical protein
MNDNDSWQLIEKHHMQVVDFKVGFSRPDDELKAILKLKASDDFIFEEHRSILVIKFSINF